MSIAEQVNSWLTLRLFTIRSSMARKLLRGAVRLSAIIAPWSLDETD
jgi:hypothetical protein